MVEALVRGNISESVAYVLESKATEVGEVLREAIRKDIDCTLCRTAGQAGDVLATSDW